MTRTAFVGLGLVAVLLAFVVPYAARGGLRPEGGDAKADQQRAVVGPSAETAAIPLGGVAPLPELRRTSGPSGGSPPRAGVRVTPAPRTVVPPVVIAPRGVTPTAPSPPPAPAPSPPAAPAPSKPPAPSTGGGGGGGGGGSFDDSG